MIVEMLDQLAEWQAQADLLEMDKRRLLDEVKIPAEVLAAQDEANKARQKLDGEMWERIKLADRLCNEQLAQVVDPEMPPEFVAALKAAQAKRDEISNKYAEHKGKAANQNAELKASIDADLQDKIKDVYAQVAQRKLEISAEFDDKATGVLDNIAKLTAEIKAAVKDEGKTVKGTFWQAVYVKGRVSWNTDMLEGLIVVLPELEKARKVGEPSVTLRRV